MREIKFRAWLTLSDYDDAANDKDYHAMIDGVSVSSGGYVGFSLDQGSHAFGSDTFERAVENGTAYEYEEWCTWEGQFNLMQYTGLKDRNGVEIYEGDIVQYETNYYGNRQVRKAEVKWHDDLEHDGFGEPLAMGYIFRGANIEVIGNVYENPELLTNKGEIYA